MSVWTLTFDESPHRLLILDIGPDHKSRSSLRNSSEAKMRGHIKWIRVRNARVYRLHMNDIDLTSHRVVILHHLKSNFESAKPSYYDRKESLPFAVTALVPCQVPIALTREESIGTLGFLLIYWTWILPVNPQLRNVSDPLRCLMTMSWRPPEIYRLIPSVVPIHFGRDLQKMAKCGTWTTNDHPIKTLTSITNFYLGLEHSPLSRNFLAQRLLNPSTRIARTWSLSGFVKVRVKFGVGEKVREEHVHIHGIDLVGHFSTLLSSLPLFKQPLCVSIH